MTTILNVISSEWCLAVVSLLIATLALIVLPSWGAFPYARQQTLFTQAEKQFYFALKAALGNRYEIFGKVRVADLVKVTRKTNDRMGFSSLARISQKHVDFVLCDPRTLAIVCAVELNDKSHQRKDRIERDRFISKVFKHTGLPIAWIEARAKYDFAIIFEAVEKAISQSAPSSAQEAMNLVEHVEAREKG